jgi:hypothetical protein
MRALAIQQSRESMAPATPVEDDRSFGSGVLTGVLGFFVKTGLTFTTPQGLNQVFNVPVTLGKAGYQAASHPVQTYDAVSRAFTKFYNSSSYHKGEVTGEILGLIGSVAATGGAGGVAGVGEGAVEIAPEAVELTTELIPTVEALQPIETAPIVSPEISVVTDAAVTAKQPFALGLTDEGLEQFAAERGATTWKDLRDPTNWRTGVIEKLADPETPIHFNLNGVNPWLGVSRAAAGRGGPTDWELLMIQQNPQWWESIQFWENGIPVPNPFQQR